MFRPVSYLRPAVLWVICGLAVSCASVTPPHEINEKYREVLEQRHTQYSVKDGDAVAVRIADLAPELGEPGVLVLPDGRSDALYLDNHLFAGKTVPQVERELREQMSRELNVEDTKISVQVTPRAEEVYLVGEFERPTTIPLRTKMTVSHAMSIAGGARVTGKTSYALLRRPYLDPQNPDLFRIHLYDESEEIFLLPGDQIILERTFLAEVILYIREYVFGIFGDPRGLLYYSILGAAGTGGVGF